MATFEHVYVKTLDEVLALLRAHGGSTDLDWNAAYDGFIRPNRKGLHRVETRPNSDGLVCIIRPAPDAPPIGTWTTREEQVAVLTALVGAGAVFENHTHVLALIEGGE